MIYAIQEPLTECVKIGWSTERSCRLRLSNLQAGCPTRLILIGTCKGTRREEDKLHRRFKKAHVRGEWFDPKKSSELRKFLQGLKPPARQKLMGFALMSKKKRAALGRRGGEKAQRKGKAHRFTRKESKKALRKRWDNPAIETWGK